MAKKYEKEYKEYYENLLKQLEKGGLSKLEVFKAKIMYEKNFQAYKDFKEIYEGNIKVVFTPEEKTQ